MRKVHYGIKKYGIVLCVFLAVLAAISLSVNTGIAQQKIDDEYTAKIRQYTIEPFSTPYVNYLPYSKNVPTPLKVLGHIAGEQEILTYSADMYRYLKALADASPRVKFFTIGKTEEGRDMVLVVVSSEKNIANLEKYKEMTNKLADPRKITEAEAKNLIKTALPFYWATGGMHSGETGSPEMLMELAYRVAIDESEFIRTIRDNLFLMITPILEVDGRDKQVDIYMAPRKFPGGNHARSLVYWGRYVSHDDNRDQIALTLQLSKNIMKTFLEYKPQVVHDLHESATHLYISTGTGPYNAWLDPIQIDEWQIMAYHEVTEMTKLGVPGVWTHAFYDGWAPNYMFYAANGHNATGRFYETQSATSTSAGGSDARYWYRPNPPLQTTRWSFRNNVNLQQSALIIGLNNYATNKERFLENFYLKSKRSVAKATNEGPAAYVFPASDPRKGQQARLLQLMNIQGVEVHRTTQPFTADGQSFDTGSYVIRMDQPYSRQADMLLDKQYFNIEDPSPYDDVGWTLGPLFNVKTIRIEDAAILNTQMTLVKDVKPEGGVKQLTGTNAFIIDYKADNNIITFRYKYNTMKINAADTSFETGGKKFDPGALIIKVSENSANVQQELDAAGKEFGFIAYGVSVAPIVPMHPVEAARVAVVHTWQSTQTEGWLRIGLDEYKIPYDYIDVQAVRDNPQLKNKYDVIIFGPSSNNVWSLVNGVQGANPQPWKKTEAQPNLGVPASTDDMRGGLDLQGVINLKNFIEQGGVFITMTSTSVLPIHFGFAGNVSIRETTGLWARGSVFKAVLSDARSPLAYGYDTELGVYFSSSPVFSGALSATGGTVTTTARPSGRGGLLDRDIPQGRPKDLGVRAGGGGGGRGGGQPPTRETQTALVPQRAAGAGRGGGGGGFAGMGAGGGTTRIIFRFTQNTQELLISGGIGSGELLAGSPGMIDAKMGRGHTILFSFNPFWRGETQGSYALVFNAILHNKYLDVGGR